MPVSDTHQQLKDNKDRWELVQDCTGGASKIKKRVGIGTGSMAGTKYLPMPNSEDTSTENKEIYKAYLLRASFVNFTGHTKKGMLGLVFRKEIEFEVPAQLEYLEKDANGGGLSLEQSVKSALSSTLETGRMGLLVDYPNVESGLTKAQIKNRNIKANILSYEAADILNWRTKVIDSVKKLSLITLQEKTEVIDVDGFGSTFKKQYRVLKLDDDGNYIQEIYGEDNVKVGDTLEPKKHDGTRWDEIPFTFAGAINNDETVDEAPLYDIAEINVSHYRNSADFEFSCFMVGQPTLVMSGLTKPWVNEVLKGEVKIGAGSAIPLPENASADLLQAKPNIMPMDGMTKKEEQMLRVGARLIQDNTGNETAYAAGIRFAGQNSDLASIVTNIEEAYKKCIVWANEFLAGGEVEIVFNINKEFYPETLDAQQVMALIMLADRGDISQKDLRGKLRKAGVVNANKSDEDIDAELEDGYINIDKNKE